MKDQQIKAGPASGNIAKRETDIRRFAFGNKEEALRELQTLKKSGAVSLSLGVDCGEFSGAGGMDWYDWLVPMLGDSLSLRLSFGDFGKGKSKPIGERKTLWEIVEHFVLKHGNYFNTVELCKRTAGRGEGEDADNIFSDEVVFAATWAKHWGKQVRLRVCQTKDADWLAKLSASQLLAQLELEGESLAQPVQESGLPTSPPMRSVLTITQMTSGQNRFAK